MQSGSLKQFTIWSQHDCWTQSPHGVPSEGQSGLAPQMPPLHCPLQQSAGPLHIAPSGEQLAPQNPPTQAFEQHSLKATHEAPSGLHAGLQAPPVQSPLQH